MARMQTTRLIKSSSVGELTVVGIRTDRGRNLQSILCSLRPDNLHCVISAKHSPKTNKVKI